MKLQMANNSMSLHRVAFLLILMSAIACTPSPSLLKRYSQVTYSSPDSHRADRPSIGFVSLALQQEAAPKSVFDLAERGQAAFIASMGATTKEAEKLVAALGAQLGPGGTLKKPPQLTQFKRRIVFTVSPGSSRPADRLQWIKIRLKLSNENFRIDSWDKAATAYEFTDLGKLQLVQLEGRTVSGTLAPPQQATLLGSLNVTAESQSSRTLTEDRNLRRRIVDLNVTISDNNTLEVVRQGSDDRDLDGNTIVDLSIRYVPANAYDMGSAIVNSFAGLKDSNGNLGDPKNVVLIQYVSAFPQKVEDIVGNVMMQYDFRRVELGDDTLNEGDDSIQIYSDSVSPREQRIVLPKEAQLMTIYEYASGDNLNDDHLSVERGLRYETACAISNSPRRIMIQNFPEARAFFDWLEESYAQHKFEKDVSIDNGRYRFCLTKYDESGGTAIASRPLKSENIPELMLYCRHLNDASNQHCWW